MSNIFHDKFGMELRVSQEGMLFLNSRRACYFPYGSMDSLNLSFLGVLQAVSHAQVCCFTAGKADKAELKELVKAGKAAMKTAPGAQAVIVDLDQTGVDSSLSNEEKMKQYKANFVQGRLSKEQLDLMKKVLTA